MCVWEEKGWSSVGDDGADPGCGRTSPSVGFLLSAPVPTFTLPPAHSRDELKRHYNLGEYWIEVEMEDLASFDEDLAEFLYKQPTEHLQLVSGTLSPNPSGLALLHSLTACPLLPLAGGSCQGGG